MLTAPPTTVQSFRLDKSILIQATPEIVWETILSHVGHFAEMNLKLEPWPGGRWYRDLGNNTGHFWGHVQVIKPHKLLEIVGPMFMSYAVASHLQYRLTEESGATRLTLIHTAVGLISPEHAEGVQKGWTELSAQIKAVAEAKK